MWKNLPVFQHYPHFVTIQNLFIILLKHFLSIFQVLLRHWSSWRRTPDCGLFQGRQRRHHLSPKHHSGQNQVRRHLRLHRHLQGRVGVSHRKAQHLRGSVHPKNGSDEGRRRKIDGNYLPRCWTSDFENRLGERLKFRLIIVRFWLYFLIIVFNCSFFHRI